VGLPQLHRRGPGHLLRPWRRHRLHAVPPAPCSARSSARSSSRRTYATAAATADPAGSPTCCECSNPRPR
jgi:hypothetical protein